MGNHLCRNVLVPEALKLTFPPGANSSKKEDAYQCPCSGTNPVPAQGLGSTPNISGNKNLIFSLYSTPELPVDFLQQQLGHKNCQCVTRRFMYCTLDNYCGKAALYKQSCSYKCYHISGFLARNSSFLVLCWTFPSKSQALVSLVFNFIQPPFWDYQES